MTTCSACARVRRVTTEIVVWSLFILLTPLRLFAWLTLTLALMVIAGAAWLSDAVTRAIKSH